MKSEVMSQEYVRRKSRQYLALSIAAVCIAVSILCLPMLPTRFYGVTPPAAIVMGLLILANIWAGWRERILEAHALVKRMDQQACLGDGVTSRADRDRDAPVGAPLPHH